MNTGVLFQFIILVVGFAGLVKGADIFVDGSATMARNFNVPSLIIGLTIVALGTSAPELAVSTLAAFQGSNEIALSNVVGSNIFNLLVVLGVCAVIYPLPVDKIVLKRDFPFSIAVTLILLIVTCIPTMVGGYWSNSQFDQEIGTVTRLIGISLFLLFIMYISLLIYLGRKQPGGDTDEKKEPMWKCTLLIIVGLTLIIGGGQGVVYSAKQIARAAGMTETLIGLTIVAVGTSLPELVTSVVAAKKGETALAIGNVLGSNIFNILFILGVSSVIRPIAVNMASVYDMMILLLISIVTFFFGISGRKITRWEGIAMVALYIMDVVFAIVR